jgi:hypothetical protein
MRSMSRVERFFERLVERPTARVFRTRLQPIQVLRRVERAMEASRGQAGGRDTVPDVFVVRLHPRDIDAIGSLDALADDLAGGALAFARGHGWTLADRPRVSIHADPSVGRGEVAIEAMQTPLSRGDGSGIVDDGGPTATRVYQAPLVQAPSAALEVREPGRPARRVTLDGHRVVIGRGAECDLVLADGHVSRRHARLDARDRVLVLTDLGSTNGTRVNGHRITEVVLGDGDAIELGETTLVVGHEPPPTPA